jgi:hypothetical protein
MTKLKCNVAISVLAEDTRVARRLIVARALFLAAAALFSFLIVGGLANIVRPSSWTGQTLLLVAFLLVASGGFVAFSGRLRR